MNISVCIIAKNEQKNIERCLKCLKSYMEEIIVVDTGSTDKTKAIASQYTKADFQSIAGVEHLNNCGGSRTCGIG